VAEGMEGRVVFSGTGANGSKYEIIQTGPTDFMIHANGRHIDTYSSLQRAMGVLKNEVPGLQQGVAEGLDKNKINDVLNNIRSGKKAFANLSTEDQTVLMTVIDEAKSKLLNLINSDNQIKTDWPHVKKFIDINQSLILMMTWDTWFRIGLIKQNPNQNTASISNDEIIVNPNLYNVLQWRFIITWLQNKIQRNTLRKSDIDLIFKLKTLIDNNPGVAEGLDSAEKISGLVDIPAFTPSGVAKVVNTGDRIMAVMNVKGVNIPLYISTGQGGKASVATGKWYPVFGVDPSTGWLNKGGEASINKFYGSKILALAAARLNNTLGDLSNVEDKLPAMKRSGQSVINKDLQPMGYSEAAANPDEFKKRVNSFLAKLGEGPFYPVDNPKEQSVAENFADGRKPGRKGLAKRVGVNTKASVSSLRKTAKNSSGEKQRMAHWLANMKAGRAKKK
jgi:hypothetical protein